MKKKFSFLMASILACALCTNAWAETDVTSKYLTNADFETDDAMSVHLCGYKADISKDANKYNGKNALYWAQDVTGWALASSKEDGNAAGVFAYGSDQQLKGNNKAAPATNPSGEGSGKALGMFAVWTGKIQYTQDVTLAEGIYKISFTYYNQSGTGDITNLFGFIDNNGTYTKYLTSTSFSTEAWHTEEISFMCTKSVSGKISIGYQAPNTGSGANPMLFVDNVKILYTSFDEFSEENPLDLTSFVGTAQSSWTGATESASCTGTDGESITRISKYSAKHFTGDVMSQTISGLPNGVYEYEYYCNANCAGWECSPISGADGATDRTLLYANSTSVGVPILNDGKSLPNNKMTLRDVLKKITVSNGTLTLKLVNEQEGANWISVQTKSLKYVGFDLTSALAALQTIYDECSAYDLTQRMATAYKNTFSEALTAAKDVLDGKTAQTKANINTATKNLSDAYTNVKSSVANYATITEKYNALDTDGQKAFLESTTGAKYNNNTLTDEDWTADYLNAVRAQGINADMTALLANPHFKTDDLTGWNINGKASPAVDVTNHDCEFFEKTFDLSQEITNLKKGTYEISVQAFQRPGNASTALVDAYLNKTWTSYATLYSTAQESDVKHICAEMQDSRVYTSGDWQTDSEVVPTGGTAKYIPNSMAGGRVWFDANHYVTTVKAVVTEDGGSMTFGFKGELPSACWLLFDNFTLKYINEDVLVDEAESEKLIKSAESLESEVMQNTVLDTLTTAKNALAADKTSGAKYNTLKNAISSAQASIKAYATLKSVYEPYESDDRVASIVTACKTMYNERTADTKTVTSFAQQKSREIFSIVAETPYSGANLPSDGGTFYLYNVEAGLFMQGGNSWGTQVSLCHDGQPMIFKAVEGGYTIDSQITNGGDNHFVGQGQFLDAAAATMTLTNIGNNFYTISWNEGASMYGYDGSSTVCAIKTSEDKNCYWQLLTADSIKTAMLTGTKVAPFEITSLIKGAQFSRNNTLNNTWTATHSGGDYQISKGNNINNNMQQWNGTFSLTQSIDLPNGLYKISFQGYYRDGNNAEAATKHQAGTETLRSFVYCNGIKTAVKSVMDDAQPTSGNGFDTETTCGYVPNSQSAASLAFTAGYYVNECGYAAVTNGKLTITAKCEENVSNAWTVLDNFRLYYCGEADTAKMTVAAANKWATFYAPFAVDVPANVYSYAITVDGSNNAVRVKIGGDAAYTLPAETPVLVYCDNKGGYTNTFIEGTAVGTPVVVNAANALVGTSVALDPVPASTSTVTNYVLQNGTKGIGWYAVNNNTLAANRAYLSVDAGVGVKGILDDATGINNVDVDADVDVNAIYNLAGQRINKMQKGINIVNGKKVMF